MTRWERSVPVYGVPVLTRGFWALLVVIAIGMVLTAVREVVGLGASFRNVRPLRLGTLENL